MNAIETRELTRRFKDRAAVENLTLAVPAGTVFGLLGPNGAGKTTTVRMLAALIAPTSGSARIAGHVLGEDNYAIQQSVGILTETPGLYDHLSAWQNLVFFARLYNLDAKRAASQTEHYLHMLNLWERRNDRVGGFSKGMRQKLAIARALLHEPEVVFLDEPTAGLDPEAARMVRDSIKEMRTEGRTIVLTTHNLPEADELCDTIGVFRTKMLRIGKPEELRTALFGRGTEVHLVGEAGPYLQTVKALPFVKQVTAQGDALSVAMDDPDSGNPVLLQKLVSAGAQVRVVEPIAHSLEDIYMELVGK